MKELNVELLQKIFPKAQANWLETIVNLLPGTSLDTENEVGSFLAEIYHESNEA